MSSPKNNKKRYYGIMNRIIYIWKSLIKNEGWPLLLFFFYLSLSAFGQAIYLLIISSLIFLYIAFRNSRLIDSTASLLAVFSVLLLIIHPSYGSGSTNICLLIGPFAFYVFGKYVVKRGGGDDSLYMAILLLLVVFWSFLIWRTFWGYIAGGQMVDTSRDVAFLGEKGNDVSATLYGLKLSVGLCGLAVFVGAKDRWKNLVIWIFGIAFVLSLFCTTYLVNRSGLFIPVIALGIAILYNSRGNVFRLFIILLVLFVVASFYFENYFLNSEVYDAYSFRLENSTLGETRSYRWLDALQRMWVSPFGWIDDSSARIGYVHNLWLDNARIAGLIPFFLFLIATIQIIRVMISLFAYKRNNVILVILSLFATMSSAAFIEPALEGSLDFCLLYIWLWGFAKQYLENCKMRHQISVRNRVS